MSDLVWVDPIERVGSGMKRHIYDDHGKQNSARNLKSRVCGVSDTSSPPITVPDKLERVEATEFAHDPNACKHCLKYTGLLPESKRPGGKGAASVKFDPFGVFEPQGRDTPHPQRQSEPTDVPVAELQAANVPRNRDREGAQQDSRMVCQTCGAGPSFRQSVAIIPVDPGWQPGQPLKTNDAWWGLICTECETPLVVTQNERPDEVSTTEREREQERQTETQ